MFHYNTHVHVHCTASHTASLVNLRRKTLRARYTTLVWVSKSAHADACTHARTCTHTQMHKHTHIQTNTQTHTKTHRHKQAHTHKHKFTQKQIKQTKHVLAKHTWLKFCKNRNLCIIIKSSNWVAFHVQIFYVSSINIFFKFFTFYKAVLAKYYNIYTLYYLTYIYNIYTFMKCCSTSYGKITTNTTNTL